MTAEEPTLASLAVQIAATVRRPTAAQRALLGQLDRVAARLRDTTFQLAVLGQFKRGKSTLLNALIGEELLSVGVLPLTTVATFLTASESPRLRLTFESGEVAESRMGSLEVLAREIAATTTEEGNPGNSKRLSRVDVGVPDAPLLKEVTLIDTPGIGSTYAHNTDAAYAALAECDAALFVCSVDPPITEVELAFLERVCDVVSHVIVVLNKVDLVDDDDRRRATSFLSGVVAERAPAAVDRRVFAVSARSALVARRLADTAGSEKSGLPELERYVRATLIGRKRELLERSIAGKMADIAAQLAGDAAFMARALSMPLVELDRAVRDFEAAMAGFEQERTGLDDAVQGEWRRALVRLNGLCAGVEVRAHSELTTRLNERDTVGQTPGGDTGVASPMAEFFERELVGLATTVEAELTASLRVQQGRYEALVERVRGTAGALLDVQLPRPLPSEWFRAVQRAHWVSEWRTESLGSVVVDGLFRLLPEPFRRRRLNAQYRQAVEDAIKRNLGDLRWIMRQNIDDSFRSLLAGSREAVEASIQATRDLLAAARSRRDGQEGRSFEEEFRQTDLSERRLRELGATLDLRRMEPTP